MKKCQSILIINEQQGKKVEQELICLYKKEATKNKMTGAISPQRKIHYSFFCITVHHIISMRKTLTDIKTKHNSCHGKSVIAGH